MLTDYDDMKIIDTLLIKLRLNDARIFELRKKLFLKLQRIKNNAFYMLKEYCRLNYNNDEV